MGRRNLSGAQFQLRMVRDRGKGPRMQIEHFEDYHEAEARMNDVLANDWGTLVPNSDRFERVKGHEESYERGGFAHGGNKYAEIHNMDRSKPIRYPDEPPSPFNRGS